MSLPNKPRLKDLMSRLCNGDISTLELDELAALLDNNEAAIREYLAYTSLHLQLGLRLQSPRSTEQLTANVMESLSGDAGLAKVTTVSSRSNGSRSNGSRSNSWFTRRFTRFVVAASLLCVAIPLFIYKQTKVSA